MTHQISSHIKIPDRIVLFFVLLHFIYTASGIQL